MPVQCIHFLCETYTQATMHQNITRKHKLGSSHFLGKYFCYNIWFTKEIYAKRIFIGWRNVLYATVSHSVHTNFAEWTDDGRKESVHAYTYFSMNWVLYFKSMAYVIAGTFFYVLVFLVRMARFFPQEYPECNGCKNQHAGYSIFILIRCTGRFSASGENVPIHCFPCGMIALKFNWTNNAIVIVRMQQHPYLFAVFIFANHPVSNEKLI